MFPTFPNVLLISFPIFSHLFSICFSGQEAVQPTLPSQNYSHVAMPRHTPYTAGYGTMGSATALPAPSYGHFQSSGLDGGTMQPFLFWGRCMGKNATGKTAMVEVRCN
jgi:hypothetical protein